MYGKIFLGPFNYFKSIPSKLYRNFQVKKQKRK